MKEWFNSLLSNCSKVSSKRIVAIFVVTNLIVISYIATFSQYDCPISMFDTLALLTGGLFGGTVIERFANQKTNGGTSQDNSENNG